jgi:hypothetical protein
MNLKMIETRFPVMSSVRQPAERHGSTDFDIAVKFQITDRFIGSGVEKWLPLYHYY